MARTITTTRSSARPRSKAPRPGRSVSSPRSRGSAARSSTRRARTGRPRRDPRQQGVQAFLDRFTVCLTSGDGQGAAACFELPSILVMGDPMHGPSRVLDDAGHVAAFFGAAPQAYRERGVASTVPEIERLDWIDDTLALARVRFPYLDADGLDLGDGETSIYVLRAAGDDIHILAAVALGVDSDRQARRRKRPIGDVGDQRVPAGR